jgi:molybdenum cofactor cytidylyltransferase
MMNARKERSVAAIVLAAGRSSRMGAGNKLLTPIGGKPIVTCVVETAIASGASPVTVVTGFEAERIAEALSGLDVTLVPNLDFAQGLSTSLRAGLNALPSEIEGAFILLGDMPLVQVSDLKALFAAFVAKDRHAICVPVRGCNRGNPVLWGASYFPEVKSLAGDAGAKRLLEVHRDQVIEVEASSDGIFTDVDTASDLARLNARAGPRG